MIPGSKGNLIYQAVDLVSALSVHVQVARSGNYSAERVERLLPARLGGINYPLSPTDMFQHFRSRNSAQDKDYVFALSGLCSGINVQLPIPRTSMPIQAVEEAFRETTKVLIRKDGLQILYFINTPQRRLGLPSRVPDWSDSRKAEGVRNTKHFMSFDATIALSWLRDKHHLALFNSSNPCTMGVEGKFIDEVSLVGPTTPVFEETTEERKLNFDNKFDENFGKANIRVWLVVTEWINSIVSSGMELPEDPYR
jgi:hypothetical protein